MNLGCPKLKKLLFGLLLDKLCLEIMLDDHLVKNRAFLTMEKAYLVKWPYWKATKVGSTATVSGTAYCSYPILPFRIIACTFFPTTFLEIAVYYVGHSIHGLTQIRYVGLNP